jgi:agmatine deiminase
MPAEWETHEATWIAWPHEESDWPGKFEAIPWVYGEVVRHLSRVETVRILVPDEEVRVRSREILADCGAVLDRVEYFILPTNRSWTRDYCPIFVRSPAEVAVTNWIFNGWAKYDNYEADNAVPGAIAQALGLNEFETGTVLEGGSIDVNGTGALLTTEECLLSPVQARNPDLSREQIETALGNYLGVDRVLWLKNGIAGDDTHGHVDDLARFVNRETIVTVVEEDPYEVNFEPTQENLEILRRFGDYRVVALPMPEPVYFAGQRLPASYANFYVANGTVLMPTFNDRNDRVALNILSEMFPDRAVIGIGCTDLVLGLGALHCMTQQQPARVA